MWQVWRFRENLREIVSLKLQYRKGKAIYDNYGIFGGGKKTSRNLYGFEKNDPGTEQTVQDTTQTQVLFTFYLSTRQHHKLGHIIFNSYTSDPLIKIQILTTPTIVWKACDLRR